MEGQDIRGLMEAYSQVYETPEVLNEAPMTAFQAAGGQAKLDQLNKNRSPRSGRATAASIEKLGQDNLFKAGGGNAAIAKGPTRNQNTRGGGTVKVPTLTRQDIINRGTVAGTKPTAAAPAKPKVSNIPPSEGTGKGGPSDIRKGSTPTSSTPATKPTATAAPTKPAATSTPKPSTPAAPAKPAGSAMDQWAKANPKLAAAKAERDRTRGTSATTNPLMKDMKSSLPAPKSPSPSTAKTGFDLAKKGVNLSAGTDLFDLVKGHLLDEGYADSEEGAMVIMVNMSEEWRKSILESYGVELDENREHEREMRKAAARERAEEKKERKGEGKKSAKAPGRLGKSAGSSYADYQELSIKSHDKMTKGKYIPGMVKNEEVEVVDEAQRARENPEGHDKEEKRKYEPVRGERTPMPPRGDKRREEFEKWYAKQMGR